MFISIPRALQYHMDAPIAKLATLESNNLYGIPQALIIGSNAAMVLF